MAYRDATFGEKILDEWSGTPAVAQVEPIVEPNGVADDIGWESMALVGIHSPILAIWAS
jgi:hypothetical protein